MGYSFDELYEELIDDFYKFDDRFAELLCHSLGYLNRDDVDAVIDKCFFFPFYGSSWHLPPVLIRERSVVIIDSNDFHDDREGIVTILHEAAHAFLGHSNAPGYSREEMQWVEDEAWAQVRKWLPVEFSDVIDTAVQEGSGSGGSGV